MAAQRQVVSPIGPLLLTASPLGLTGLALPGARPSIETSPPDPAAEAVLDGAAAQLSEYFAGGRREFDLPLDIAAAAFQTRVWRTIAAIPFGETASYGAVAARAGAPLAYRAAGAACGAHPVALVVPGHRVIAADGGLHGYGGGLEMKRWLLEHEGLRLDGATVRRPALLAV